MGRREYHVKRDAYGVSRRQHSAVGAGCLYVGRVYVPSCWFNHHVAVAQATNNSRCVRIVSMRVIDGQYI